MEIDAASDDENGGYPQDDLSDASQDCDDELEDFDTDFTDNDKFHAVPLLHLVKQLIRSTSAITQAKLTALSNKNLNTNELTKTVQVTDDSVIIKEQDITPTCDLLLQYQRYCFIIIFICYPINIDIKYFRLLFVELRSNEAAIRRGARILIARHSALVARYSISTLKKTIPLMSNTSLLPQIWDLLNEDIVG